MCIYTIVFCYCRRESSVGSAAVTEPQAVEAAEVVSTVQLTGIEEQTQNHTDKDKQHTVSDGDEEDFNPTVILRYEDAKTIPLHVNNLITNT